MYKHRIYPRYVRRVYKINIVKKNRIPPIQKRTSRLKYKCFISRCNTLVRQINVPEYANGSVEIPHEPIPCTLNSYRYTIYVSKRGVMIIRQILH